MRVGASLNSSRGKILISRYSQYSGCHWSCAQVYQRDCYPTNSFFVITDDGHPISTPGRAVSESYHWMSLFNGWAALETKRLPYVELKSPFLWLLLTSKRKPSYIFFIEVALSVYFSYMSLLRLFFYSWSVPISSITLHAILLKVWRT